METIFRGKTICIDGCDCSGKSTLVKDLRHENIALNSFLVDRSMLTSIVYAEAFRRKDVDVFSLINEFERQLNSNRFLLIYLNTPVEVIEERMKIRGDDRIKLEDIRKIKDIYDEFIGDYIYHDNIIKLVNYENYALELFNIDNRVSKSYNNKKIVYDYFGLLNSLNNLREQRRRPQLNNYTLDYAFENLKDFIENFEFPIYDNIEYDKKIYHNEENERQMILSTLKFNTQVMIDKYKENFYSRRFVSTNDSCLSFTQVEFLNNEIKFNFVFRSSDVKNVLPVDLKGIVELIKNYLNWMDRYVGDTIYTIKSKSISIRIQLNDAHIV